MELFEYKKFKDINLGDVFFDSLKEDYSEFENWFNRKPLLMNLLILKPLITKLKDFYI